MFEALGNLGDFVGGVGVVVTLLYLATQIRQNTNALQAAGRQAISDGYRESNRMRLPPEIGLAWANGLSVFPNQPHAERHLFFTVATDEALFFQTAFALRESGQLEEETYAAYLAWFASVVTTPGGSVWWQTCGRPIFTPRMVSAVDERVAAGNLHDIRMIPGVRPDEPPEAVAGPGGP